MVTEREITFWRLYHHYKNQLLFKAGGLMDQPNVYLQAMETIDQRCNHIATENARRK